MSQDELLYPFMSLSTTRIVDCNKLENVLDTDELFMPKDFDTRNAYCYLYHYSKCGGNRVDLVQVCNATIPIKGDLVESKNDAAEIQASLNVLDTKAKEKILTHPSDFVIQTHWEGENINKIHPWGPSRFGSTIFSYYQGSIQYLVNFEGKLKGTKMGVGSGLEMILQVPQRNPTSLGIQSDMDGFILDFSPPLYASGAKR